MPIVTEDHDGHQQDDGSHFTGEASVFVEPMRRKGLLTSLFPQHEE